ncbi:MAG: hypothetical protein EOM85_03180 [Candidatus Moranbacteria bacterium]|nr:hypothetical protein [Candidatus Moranbacteria bacterium]
MQESIKLKNLMDTLVAAPQSKGGITQETANEISYALMNFEFLSKTAGLEKSWKRNKDSNQKGNYEIQQMIGGLIQTGLFYFLGVEFEKATENKPTVFTGNMFTILANRYLIPFSMYLDSIAEVMKEELREATIIAQRPATNIHLGDSSLNAKDMYQEKQKIIKSDGFPKGYYYPGALVEIGQKGGESLYNNTTISGIHFKFNITKLQTIFKEKTEKNG